MDPVTWVYIIIMIIAMIIAIATAPKPKNAKPPALADLTVPTAEDGREVVDFGGTVWIDDPNVLWFGDLSTSPIKTSSGK